MNRLVKELIGRTLFFSGPTLCYRTFFAGCSQGFLVLAYHQIADDSAFPNPYLEISGTTRLSVFKEQIRYLMKHYELISLVELLRYFEAGHKVPPKSVLLTFDDGYRNVYRHAFPVLKSRKLPAVVFLAGEAVNGYKLWCDKLLDVILKTEVKSLRYRNSLFSLKTLSHRVLLYHHLVSMLKYLGIDERQKEIGKISEKAGVTPEDRSERYLKNEHIYKMLENNISFGAHSMTHPLLGIIEDRGILEREIKQSVNLINEITNGKCFSFAYPFGDEGAYSEQCVEILKKIGVKLAFTTIRGSNREACNRYALRRFIVQRDSQYYLRLQLSGLLDG